MGGQCLPPSLDSADDRVLDRDHAGIGVAVLDGAHGSAESRHRDLLDRMSPDLRDRRFGVRAAVALKSDAQRQLARVKMAVRFGSTRADRFGFQHVSQR